MSLADLNPRHLRLIGRYSIRHAVRGGAGLVFLLLASFFGLMVAHVLITPLEAGFEGARKYDSEASDDQIAQEFLTQFDSQIEGLFEWFLDVEDAKTSEERQALEEQASSWKEHLIENKPALLSAVFFVLLFGMPFVLPFGAFNQTAGDIGSRGLRYHLLRTERSNIFLGRFLGTALFAIAVQGVTILTVVLYVALKLDLYAPADVVAWGAYGFVALSILALPYVALCSWISARNRSSMASLVLCKLVIGGVLLASWVAKQQWEPAAAIKWLLPWAVQNRLLSPEWSEVGIAVAACFGYTALYLFLGHRHFLRRDL